MWRRGTAMMDKDGFAYDIDPRFYDPWNTDDWD
jgi:hypothetical protein